MDVAEAAGGRRAPGAHDRVQDRGEAVQRGAARALSVAADEDSDRTHLPQRRGELEILEGLAHPVRDGICQVRVLEAGDVDGAHSRHGDAARTIDDEAEVGVGRAPDGQLHLVAGADDVIARYCGQRILRRRSRGRVRQQVGAETADVSLEGLVAAAALHVLAALLALVVDEQLEFAGHIRNASSVGVAGFGLIALPGTGIRTRLACRVLRAQLGRAAGRVGAAVVVLALPLPGRVVLCHQIGAGVAIELRSSPGGRQSGGEGQHAGACELQQASQLRMSQE